MAPETSKILKKHAGWSEQCIKYIETWFLKVSVTMLQRVGVEHQCNGAAEFSRII
jgi:hypothetical protein